MIKKFQLIFITILLGAVFYIVASDLGSSSLHSSGAGDIWWTDAQEIEDSYQSLKN